MLLIRVIEEWQKWFLLTDICQLGSSLDNYSEA